MKRLLVSTVAFAALATAGSSAAATTPLHGVFEATIKGVNAQLNGKWLIRFAPNGAYAVVKEPNTKTMLIGGRSTVSGKSVAFADATGPLACTGKQAHGSYSWKITGKTLKLTPAKETCVGRRAVLGTAAFTKVG